MIAGPSEIPYDLPLGSSGRPASCALMSSMARLSPTRSKNETSANDAPANQASEKKLPVRRANIRSPPPLKFSTVLSVH